MYSTSGVRQQIDTILSLAQLRATPEAYKDRVVMLGGGEILSAWNLAEGTLLEILHKPLDSTDRPLDTDQTEGRFMALCEGYHILDWHGTLPPGHRAAGD